MITKKDLSKVLSLSCVENYFIAWIKSFGYPDGILYNKSYAPFSTILNDFLDGNARYESYNKIERVMTTAKNYGLADYTVNTKINIDQISVDLAFNKLVLVEVNKSFFKSCSLKPWREDHYICITGITTNGEVKYVNQFPLSEGSISLSDMNEYFGGRVLVYGIMGDIDSSKYLEDEDLQFAEIIFSEDSRDITNEPVIRICRDIIGIIRISRRRLQSWFRFASSERRFSYDTPIESFFDDYFHTLDLLYVRLEAAHLRNKPSKESVLDKINEIASYEKRLSQLVKMRRIKNEY